VKFISGRLVTLNRLIIAGAIAYAAGVTLSHANEVDDMVAAQAAPDVPAFTDILKAESAKDSITDFAINPVSLTVYITARGNDQGFINQARATGRGICKAMSKSQFDRGLFIHWQVSVMAWVGKMGEPTSGYDPVLKCELGGQTAAIAVRGPKQ
jgi:hypothetical protein